MSWSSDSLATWDVCVCVCAAGFIFWYRRGMRKRFDLEDGKKPRALGMHGRHSDDSAAERPNAGETSVSNDLFMPGRGPHSIATYALAEHIAAASSNIDEDGGKPSDSLTHSEGSSGRVCDSPGPFLSPGAGWVYSSFCLAFSRGVDKSCLLPSFLKTDSAPHC